MSNSSPWHEHTGNGSRTVLLLHGLGATGAVWKGLTPLLEQRQMKCIVVDFSGHGSSPWADHYSIGQLAAAIAPRVKGETDLYVIGHSLGAYVGLALASRWFGVNVAGVLGVGPKITWSEADLKGTQELAARPVRWYAQEAETIARYRRVSGLEEKVTTDADILARGITQTSEGCRLSQDPRTFMVGGAPFGTLVSSAVCKVLLARGEHDGMVSLDELRAHNASAVNIDGAGHNVHVEKPEAIAALLGRLMS